MKIFNSIAYIFTAFSLLICEECNLKKGMKAPGFTLSDQDSISHSLHDYFGQKVVIYYYPKDNTPGCTKEACSIRDKYASFDDYNIVTFGISYDTPESHKKFIEKYQLPFSLLSDGDKSVSKLYCSDGWFFPDRKTILIDEKGLIHKIIEDVNIRDHGMQILDAFGITTKSN